MPESEKKRRSGRARDESSETPGPKAKKAKKPSAAEPEEKLHTPWGPLVWLLVPLFASVAYGLWTRGH